MGQSGDLSAMGLAIESYFRTPPLALLSGSNYGLGVAGSNPLRYMILDPCQGFDPAVQIDSGKEVDGSIQQRRVTLVGKTYPAEISWKGDPENCYYPLLGIFGRDIQSTLHAGTSTTITGATNASPIVITDTAHGYANGDHLVITAVTGNTAANGSWIITYISANQYSLNGGVGNANYISGGSATQVTAYSHKFLPGNKKPSFAVETDIADGTYGEFAAGVVFDKLEFDFGKEMMVKASLLGHRYLPNTYPNSSGVNTKTIFGAAPVLIPPVLGALGNGTNTFQATAAPTYVDVPMSQNGDGPLTFGGMQFGTQPGFASAFVLINGTAYPIVLLEGCKIVVQQEVDSRMSGGSGYDPGTVTANKFLVTGTLVAEWDDMTLPSAMLDFDQVSINFLLVGSSIGSGGYNYSMEFHLPHVKLSKAPVGLTDGTIVINSDFVAKMDDSLGYSLMVISQNGFNNASLSGLYVAPCVTTAAIPNNTTGTAVVNTTSGLVVGGSYNLAGATPGYNPCTVASITDSTHVVLTGAAAQADIQGNIPTGASLSPAGTTTYSAGGLGGWKSS